MEEELMGSHVAYFEITTASDAPALQKFYSEMFGWQVNVMPEMGGYGLVDTGTESAIGGGIGPAQGAPGVRMYVYVENLDDALLKAESLGGKTVMPPTKVSDEFGSIAVFSDLDGNGIGLWDRPGVNG
jgi:predicted enzyme related to lactoylglutathione lyase